MAEQPEIEVLNRQRKVPVHRKTLQTAGELAVREILVLPAPQPRGLQALAEISIAIVSDKTIAKVHQDFMEDPAPTDVITFGHGELVISAETAVKQAGENHTSPHAELVLYIVHGLLHLHGFDDTTAAAKAQMDAVQFPLVEKILRHPGAGITAS